jgi:hypothetical protein
LIEAKYCLVFSDKLTITSGPKRTFSSQFIPKVFPHEIKVHKTKQHTAKGKRLAAGSDPIIVVDYL